MSKAGLILAAIVTAGLGGCAVMPPPTPGDPLVATLEEEGGDVILRPDQQLIVRLYLEEGTGLVWRLGQVDHLAVLTPAEAFTGRFGRPLPPSVGHGGVVQTFSFRASSRGEGKLIFVLQPSRDNAAQPQKVATYNIRVL